MKIIDKLNLFFAAIILLASCKESSFIGTYTYNGIPDHLYAFYYLQIDEDCTFKLQYVAPLGGMASSGLWHQKWNKVVLESNVQDVVKFPLFVEVDDDAGKDTDCLIINTCNMNWMYYEWYCVVNDDTVRVTDDVLSLEKAHPPYNLYFFIKPLGLRSLNQLPDLPNSFAKNSFLLNIYAQSETIKIDSIGCYTISCDEVFGSQPLQYRTQHNRIFKRTKGNGIRDVNSGFLLTTDSCGMNGFMFRESDN